MFRCKAVTMHAAPAIMMTGRVAIDMAHLEHNFFKDSIAIGRMA